MELELRALLQAAPAVTAIAPAERINWAQHPQEVPFPALILHLVGGDEGLTLDGPDGLARARVQVDCIGRDFAEALALADAVRARLHGYSGGAIQLIAAALERAGVEAGAAERPVRRTLDFEIVWSRS